MNILNLEFRSREKRDEGAIEPKRRESGEVEKKDQRPKSSQNVKMRRRAWEGGKCREKAAATVIARAQNVKRRPMSKPKKSKRRRQLKLLCEIYRRRDGYFHFLRRPYSTRAASIEFMTSGYSFAFEV